MALRKHKSNNSTVGISREMDRWKVLNILVTQGFTA